jgi:hypothetical protein
MSLFKVSNNSYHNMDSEYFFVLVLGNVLGPYGRIIVVRMIKGAGLSFGSRSRTPIRLYSSNGISGKLLFRAFQQVLTSVFVLFFWHAVLTNMLTAKHAPFTKCIWKSEYIRAVVIHKLRRHSNCRCLSHHFLVRLQV